MADNESRTTSARLRTDTGSTPMRHATQAESLPHKAAQPRQLNAQLGQPKDIERFAIANETQAPAFKEMRELLYAAISITSLMAFGPALDDDALNNLSDKVGPQSGAGFRV